MKKVKDSFWQNTWFWASFIFILAAAFRLTNLSLIEFKADEALAMLSAASFYQKPFIASNSGVSSIGILYPPLSYFIITILSLFSSSPVFVSFLIALINSALVVLFYLLLRKYYGKLVAIVASVWMASSPWSILFSRKIWNPDLVLILVLPILYFLLQILKKPNKKAYLWLFLCLALLTQLHFSGLYLLLIIGGIFFYYKVKPGYQQAGLGFALGIIPALPLFFYNINSQPFCRDCLAFGEYLKLPKQFQLANLIRPWQFATGLNFTDVLGQDYQLFLQQYPVVAYISGIFLLSFILALLGAYLLYKDKKQHWLLLIVGLVPVLYFILRLPAYMYYFVILSPFIYLFLALTFKNILQFNKSKLWQSFIIFIFITIQIANMLFAYSFFSFVKAKQVIAGDYGPTYVYTKKELEPQIAQYQSLPFYPQLRAYVYVFKNPQHLHQKLGEYLAQKRLWEGAENEFAKALETNSSDVAARANLIQILAMRGKIEESQVQLEVLKAYDSTVAARLEQILLPKYQQ
ncbi:hypothetical protein GYA49_02255 [Candidatus Beckwithbacteria bacterium]|nr:hypothetical protein [Candidatus Beckwithbacteria bacterium]